MGRSRLTDTSNSTDRAVGASHVERPSDRSASDRAALPPLELLKTIGDDTRYAIYQAIAAAPEPITTSALAKRIGLHANTIRPHLDRMRDAGLLVREIAARGGVGRPGHRYRVATATPLVARPAAAPPRESDRGLELLLVDLAVAAGVTAEEARALGFRHGDARARRERSPAGQPPAGQTLDGQPPDELRGVDRPGDDVLIAELDRLGFLPRLAPVDDDDPGENLRVDFGACPFEHGSEAVPEVACSLHEGLVAGLAARRSGSTKVTFVRDVSESHERRGCHALVSATKARYDSTIVSDTRGPHSARGAGHTAGHTKEH